jgi:hypothetical protein
MEINDKTKTIIIKNLYQCGKDENLHWLGLEPNDVESKGFRIDADKQLYLLDLTIVLPIELVYVPFKNEYSGHEKVSDIVTKTWEMKFEVPFKFYFGNSLDLFGTVYTDNIYFDFKPNEVQWRKWKKQSVKYDSYSHYFIYLERDFLFSNGGYGSHMDIKATFCTDTETNLEYALIQEIQFYDVKDPDNTIKIGQIRSDIFEYEIKKME